MTEPNIEEIVARVERIQNNYPFPEDLIALIASWRARGEALATISSLAGKTLICGSYTSGDDASQAYSLGANRAFDQCASIARAALRDKP